MKVFNALRVKRLQELVTIETMYDNTYLSAVRTYVFFSKFLGMHWLTVLEAW